MFAPKLLRGSASSLLRPVKQKWSANHEHSERCRAQTVHQRGLLQCKVLHEALVLFDYVTTGAVHELCNSCFLPLWYAFIALKESMHAKHCGSLCSSATNNRELTKTSADVRCSLPAAQTLHRTKPNIPHALKSNVPVAFTINPDTGGFHDNSSVWSEEEIHSVKVTHKPPVDIADKIALSGVRFLRWSFDWLAGFKTGAVSEDKYLN
jgi:Alternative oxidase